ncbi:general secretion pathway protein GspK [Mesorhizobium sp. B2-4-10]|nr:general secretion pathway protein GspK [Mesorhizobium sp. B2-4-10]TPM93944.1 general secretion pathway protein GspK [Mesorhizobium sp. B2-1-5]
MAKHGAEMGLAAVGMSSATSRRGAILVSVLWIMIFLGFLAVILRAQMTGVVASVRVTEDKASARILAEAGLSQAAAEIRAGPPDGVVALSDQISSTITLPAGVASISARNEALRIDLNTAERPLIVGALRAAGAAPGTAEDLATKIIGHRARPTPANGQPAGSAPQQAGNDTKLFQTVSELAAFPGITPDMAIAIEPYVTVSSGLAGVRLEALDDGLLGDIPGLPPSVRKAIKDFHAGRLSREQLDQSLAGVTFNTLKPAPSWRVDLRTTLRSGYSESFEALILVSNADEAPYRVLDWRRAAIELE